jgi:hypothetical protein
VKARTSPATKIGTEPRLRTSIYLPVQVHQRLQMIASKVRCKVHDLFMEGIAHVVSKRAAVVEDTKESLNGELSRRDVVA